MSNELGSGAAARDAGVARIRKLTRGAIVCATLLAGAFAGLAAASTHVRKATDAGTHRSVPPAVPAPAPDSAQVPAPAAPSQAPSQSTAPPVASSGGS